MLPLGTNRTTLRRRFSCTLEVGTMSSYKPAQSKDCDGVKHEFIVPFWVSLPVLPSRHILITFDLLCYTYWPVFWSLNCSGLFWSGCSCSIMTSCSGQPIFKEVTSFAWISVLHLRGSMNRREAVRSSQVPSIWYESYGTINRFRNTDSELSDVDASEASMWPSRRLILMVCGNTMLLS